jgi:AbrB family looped-hinge helix DNA binding protein
MVKENVDITVVSSKGQVVIPQEIRRKLGITPKTKMLVYGYRDAVILKKIEVPDVEKKLKEMYRRIEKRIAKYGELTQEEIEEEIQKYRRAKRF